MTTDLTTPTHPYDTPATGWSQDAWRRVAPTYAGILAHPFVAGLKDGSLEREVFHRYLLDDARYLTAYGRALALVAVRMPTADDVALMAASSVAAAQAERLLHETVLAAAGIDPEAPGEPTPTCVLYTSTLLAAAAAEPAEVALAALLPCFRVYAEVGAWISEADSAQHPYTAWIQTYADPAFADAVRRTEALADRLAAEGTERHRERMHEAYARSTLLEWMFWDASWRGETWPAVTGSVVH